MMTPDDGRSDGAKTDYLDRPLAWRNHDADLFDALLAATRNPESRRIEHAEAGMLPGARFFGEMTPDRRTERIAWFARALASLEGAEIVFFDPDNGMEVKSTPFGAKNSSKFLYWEEVREAWERGFSLLIFQHFGRVPRDPFCEGILRRLAAETPEG